MPITMIKPDKTMIITAIKTPFCAAPKVGETSCCDWLTLLCTITALEGSEEELLEEELLLELEEEVSGGRVVVPVMTPVFGGEILAPR